MNTKNEKLALIYTCLQGNSNRKAISKRSSRWISNLLRGDKEESYILGGEVLSAIQKLRVHGDLDMVLGLIDGVALVKIKDSHYWDKIGRSLGYAIACARSDGTSVFSMAVNNGRVEDLLDSLYNIDGMKTLGEVVGRVSAEGVALGGMDNHDASLPGYVFAHHIVRRNPQLMYCIEVDRLLSSLSPLDSINRNRTPQLQDMLGHLARGGLGSWLDSPATRRYRAHLTSGPISVAKDISHGLVVMDELGMLNDEQLFDLTAGKRMNRLDKTLGRALLTKENKTNEKMSDFRVRVRRLALESRCSTEEKEQERKSGRSL